MSTLCTKTKYKLQTLMKVREKGWGKTVVSTNLKQTSTKFGVALFVCRAILVKIQKRYMDELCVYNIFIND